MKKGLRIFIGSLLIVIGALIALCVYAFDCKDIPKSLNMVATTFSAITSSLGVIIATINLTEIRKQFAKNKQTESFNHWYKELVIDRHLHKIQEFFDGCESLVESHDFEKERKKLNGDEYDRLLQDKIFANFTPQYTKINQSVTNDLAVIDTDHSVRVSNQFSQFQDDFTKLVYNSPMPINNLRTCIKQHYREIVSMLMKYEMAFNHYTVD